MVSMAHTAENRKVSALHRHPLESILHGLLRGLRVGDLINLVAFSSRQKAFLFGFDRINEHCSGVDVQEPLLVSREQRVSHDVRRIGDATSKTSTPQLGLVYDLLCLQIPYHKVTKGQYRTGLVIGPGNQPHSVGGHIQRLAHTALEM